MSWAGEILCHDGDQQRRLITFKLKPGDEAGQRWGSFLVGDEFAWEQRRAGEGGCGWVRAGNQETVREERLSSTLLGAVPGGCEFNRKDRLTGYYFMCAEVYRKEVKLNKSIPTQGLIYHFNKGRGVCILRDDKL